MGLTDTLSLRGRYRIREADSGLLLAESPNKITTAGKAHIAAMMYETSGYDTGLAYIAIGTGTTNPEISDTQLVTEYLRGEPTMSRRVGNVITIGRYFPSAEVDVRVREVGVFAHSTATSTANSGILFSRSLMDYDNTTNEYNIIVEYELEVG